MVAAANPLAAAAGLKVLKAGGSAIDAAVAVQAVLGLVEPQSSGLGSGAPWSTTTPRPIKVTAYDGREVAPRAPPAWFLKPDGTPMGFGAAIVYSPPPRRAGRSAMIYLAHKEHGAKPWSGLFGDAEQLADGGFVVSPRLLGMIASPIRRRTASPT